MTMRPRLHYHTDCDFFAGCENMIANFLNDERIHRYFDVSFSYRRSGRYQSGLSNRVHKAVNNECYPILAGNVFTKYAAKLTKPIHRAAQILNYVLLLRYCVLAWNVAVLYFAWRNRNIDILHINNGGYPAQSSCLAAAIAARLVGIDKVIMVVNNIAVSNRYRHWSPERWLDCLVARSVDVFVTGSITAGRALQAALSLPNEKLITLHNGIAVRPNTETRRQTRLRLGLKDGDLVFGVVALLEWRKGHRVLLNAVSELKDLVPAEKMPMILIEGEGPEQTVLKEMVEQLAINRWVRFVGSERNIYDFVQTLDVVVFPSIANEDFPNVVLEAMALGKPVLASRIAGTPEQIEDGVTGWLVEPGDFLSFSRKMSVFVEDNNQAAIMGVKARARFEKLFTAEIAVSQYLNLYQFLLNRSSN